MSKHKYLNDLKNLQPLPLDKIPDSTLKKRVRGLSVIKQLKPVSYSSNNKSSIINNQSRTESSMEKLNTSKTMWGFGIAVFLYIMQSILVAFNITSPDNLILKTFIEVVIAVSGFFGVYGVRDALRKMAM